MGHNQENLNRLATVTLIIASVLSLLQNIFSLLSKLCLIFTSEKHLFPSVNSLPGVSVPCYLLSVLKL